MVTKNLYQKEIWKNNYDEIPENGYRLKVM